MSGRSFWKFLFATCIFKYILLTVQSSRIRGIDVTQISYKFGHKTVQDFVSLFEKGQLNLEPGFQRDSVWQPTDRRKLIESVLYKYPVPSVFLYRRIDDGRIMYDVMDGKQRLETILRFQGLGKFRNLRFSAPARIDSDEMEDWAWRDIQRRGHEHLLMGYEIQTVEIEGDLSDIIELFVRINSTGKSLTTAERRHAKYFRSSFLLAAEDLARKNKNYISTLLSGGQISRMKHVELVSELLASVYNGGVLDKKKAVDKIISGDAIDRRSLERCSKAFVRVLNLIKKMFPDLAATRFAKVVDFYTLFLHVHELDTQNYILIDKERNRAAQQLLIWLSNGVDEVRQQIRKAEGARAEQNIFKDYLFTVQGDTDSLATRKRRATILAQILGGLFEEKDSRRNFTIEQRRLLWHSDENKKCNGCKQPLTWNNFTIDHIVAHVRGGRTKLSNAALRCRSCNSSKGMK